MQRAIRKVLSHESTRNLSFINMHGVGKRVFDNMTSVAIDKAGLRRVPVNCFEANFGHSSGSTSLLDSYIGGQISGKERNITHAGLRRTQS